MDRAELKMILEIGEIREHLVGGLVKLYSFNPRLYPLFDLLPQFTKIGNVVLLRQALHKLVELGAAFLWGERTLTFANFMTWSNSLPRQAI